MVIVFQDFLLPSAKSFFYNENFVNISRQLLKNRADFFMQYTISHEN